MPYGNRNYNRALPGRYDTYPRGSFFGGLAKGIGHFVGGVVTGVAKGVGTFVTSGNPIKAIGSAIGATYNYDVSHGVLPGAAQSTAGPLVMPPIPMLSPTTPPALPGGQLPTGVITQSPLGTPVSAVGLAKQGVGQKGYHVNKSWSYRRKTGQLVAPGSVYVRNRRMNWANGKAMGRAERRIASFVKHAQRYIRWVNPKKAGHAAPKFKKRRAA